MQMSKFAEEKLPNMKLIFNMNILNFIILTAILTIGNATKGATYYLKVANASTAYAASSWNTAQDGTGTNLSSWRTAGTNHTYIVPTGVTPFGILSIQLGTLVQVRNLILLSLTEHWM